MRSALFVILACSGLFASASCERSPAEPPPPPATSVPASAVSPAAVSSEWNEQLREIAATYTSWKRVSDQANYSPVRCIFIPPEGAQYSEAKDGAPHARKLYFLFAKNDKAYLDITYPMGIAGDERDPHPKNLQQPVGQVIVKEAFHPVPATAAEARAAMTSKDLDERRTIPATFCGYGDNLSKMGDLQGLYVMLKTPADSPGTDAGWVYATITPAGEITAAGRIESCMECHVDAPHDRLHGAQWHRRLDAIRAIQGDAVVPPPASIPPQPNEPLGPKPSPAGGEPSKK